MEISVLEALLTAEQYEACENMAVRFLGQPSHDPQTQAQAKLLLCRSRIGQKHYTAAIEPGHVAAFIAREHGLYDLLGQALCDTAYAFFYMGHYDESARLYREFLQNEDSYSDELKAIGSRICFSLATALLAADNQSEAEVFFRKAWHQLQDAGDLQRANEARSNLLWIALRRRQLGDAKALLDAGENYLAQFPMHRDARVKHLIDLGSYRLLQQAYQQARAIAAEALDLTDDPWLKAEAQLLLARSVLALGLVLPAFCTALEAKENAEDAQRKDVVAEIDDLLDDIIFQHETVVLEFVRDNTGLRPKKQEG